MSNFIDPLGPVIPFTIPFDGRNPSKFEKVETLKNFGNLLQKPFKPDECCISTHRDKGKKVTGFGLFEYRNTSEMIYTPVLTRRWVMDFHSGLEKSTACSEVTDS